MEQKIILIAGGSGLIGGTGLLGGSGLGFKIETSLCEADWKKRIFKT